MEQKNYDFVGLIVKERNKARLKATYEINYEMYSFFAYFGKEVSNSPFKKKYGDDFYRITSESLLADNPEPSLIFSEENIKRIEKFYCFFEPEIESNQSIISTFAYLPWEDICLIIEKCKSISEALFYVKETITNGWSNKAIRKAISSDLFNRTNNQRKEDQKLH